MYKEALDSLRVALQGDDVFMSFNTTMGRIRNTFDYEALNREISTLHSTRMGRNLHLEPSIPESDKIVRAMLENSSFRSRLMELAAPARRYRKTMKRKIEMITKYIFVEHETQFGGIRHKTDKELVVEVLLEPALSLQSEVDSVIESVDEVVKDIDQAGFATRDTVELVGTIHRNMSIGKPGGR